MTKRTVSMWKQRGIRSVPYIPHNNSVTRFKRKIKKRGFFKVGIGNYTLQENSNDDGVRISTCDT